MVSITVLSINQQCDFGSFTQTPALWINETYLSCFTPASPVLGPVDVTIYYNGVRYSDDVVQFEFYGNVF